MVEIISTTAFKMKFLTKSPNPSMYHSQKLTLEILTVKKIIDQFTKPKLYSRASMKDNK